MGVLGLPASVQLETDFLQTGPLVRWLAHVKTPAVSQRCRRLLKVLFLLGINLREVLISLPL